MERPQGFKVIGITMPGEVPDEALRITQLLDSGECDLMHIRKPEWTAASIEQLLAGIPPRLYPQLILHDCHELAVRYGLGGVHLNRRNPVAPSGVASVSISMHAVEQLEAAGHYNYVTLSPVYDSLSKPGYLSGFALAELAPHLQGRNVIALGGVTPERFNELARAGFAGAAMLGHLWK